VLTRVGGGEGESTFIVAFLGDDAMVVVKDFLDGDVEAERWVNGEGVCLGRILRDCVVPFLDDSR
jgi:hypothetical protein